MDDLTRAKNILLQGGHTCVLVKGDSVYTSDAAGVAFLLSLYQQGKSFCEYAVADKVVGRAAAFLMQALQIKCVHADVISEGAVEVLQRATIKCQYGLIVKNIINRKKDGICPMEAATAAIDDCAKAIKAIQETLKRLTSS